VETAWPISDVVALSFAMKTLTFIAAAFFVWVNGRILDRLNGVSFRNDVFNKIAENALSLGVYRGLRYLALCLLAGYIYS
jgi:hypothetical protein